MNDITRASFVDVDPATDRSTPTTFGSMHSSLTRRHPVGETVSDNIRDLLLTAVDHFALSYEQANAGRGQLYERLTNDAFLKAVLALELALRERPGRGSRVKLETLIAEAVTTGLLAGTPELKPISMLLRDNRNALAHGGEDQRNRTGAHRDQPIRQLPSRRKSVALLEELNRILAGRWLTDLTFGRSGHALPEWLPRFRRWGVAGGGARAG